MKPRCAALLILTGLLVSSRSLADVIALDLYGPCGGKKPGDDCTTDRGAPGVCNEVYWSDAGPTMPLTKGATFTKGTAGKGGAGAADMKHDGDPGVQADMQAFP